MRRYRHADGKFWRSLVRKWDHGQSEIRGQKPDAVKGFLHAYLKCLKDAVKDPAAAIDFVLKRNEVATKPLEVKRRFRDADASANPR